MPHLTSDPSISIPSRSELFSIAMAMEADSAARYLEIADRMREAGKEDLAQVFETLARTKLAHRDEIAARAREAGGAFPEMLSGTAPGGVFSDEGLAHAAAELVDAYRAYAVAVRNEERAFAFWSYMAARGISPEIRRAAEQMARAKLGQAKAFRRERRKAFLAAGGAGRARGEPQDLSMLENEVSRRLEALAALPGSRTEYRDLAAEAQMLSRDLASASLGVPLPPGAPSPENLEALCEWLADRYVEAGDRSRSQETQTRAQSFAAAAIKRLARLRKLA
ncbi:ferritin family protein [Enterovirga sp.]|uniref:ferritin-like domain-containing protein n=1 Tax=Enterovirga sp. TaxID=2026350 RepID=UPI002D0AEF9B|nr:ferritin family protein [Enterovirga sp.]HMO30463.1 ferritin family protein [Enterovirga sp.]